MSNRTFRFTILIVTLSLLPACSLPTTTSPTNQNTMSAPPTINSGPATPASPLSEAKIYLRDPVSDYDLAQAKARLERIPQSSPEYNEARQLLTYIETLKKSRPQAIAAESSDAILHVENNKRIPVAVTEDDFYAAQDAVFMNDEYEKALALVQRGKLFMVENDSPVTVLEPLGYLTKIKVKKTGRVGWVKSSWIQAELSRPALDEAFLRAARDGEIEAVKSLLGRGANINIQNDKGMTALMQAADGGHVEVVKLLIARGANLNLKDNYGWTALSGLGDGADERQQSIIRILKRAGAK